MIFRSGRRFLWCAAPPPPERLTPLPLPSEKVRLLCAGYLHLLPLLFVPEKVINLLRMKKMHGSPIIRMSLLKQPCLMLIFLLIVTARSAFAQNMDIKIASSKDMDLFQGFNRQVGWVEFSLIGQQSFKENNKLVFSDSSKVNLDTLDQQAMRLRAQLPKHFLDGERTWMMLDSKPGKDGHLWFETALAAENLKGQLFIYGAFKVIFQGSDPETEGSEPKILAIQLITDPSQLQRLKATIQRLIVDNHSKVPAPVDPNKPAEEALPPGIKN